MTDGEIQSFGGDKVNATPRFAGSRIYFVLSPKSKKRCWSLRENDRYDIICGVNGKVYFSAHFYRVIVCKISCMPPFLAIMFSSKRPINAKSAYNVIFGIVSGVKIS